MAAAFNDTLTHDMAALFAGYVVGFVAYFSR
jgi:hypothetical protein